MINLVAASTIWILSVTLSGDDSNTRQYEFKSKPDCEAVIPAITELYIGLGESSVTATCEPEQKSGEFLPLNQRMIMNL